MSRYPEDELVVKAPEGEKIVLLVFDGLGDIPHPDFGGKTPLEAAKTPNLDRLAREGALGRIIPVAIGITPGSGPAHLGLFGYDPLELEIGRGVLEALGIGVALNAQSLSARANFATMDAKGIITDRRAGRIPTEKTIGICKKLQESIGVFEGVKVEVFPAKEHRFVVVFRGEGLADGLSDADPHREGSPLPEVRATKAGAEKAARVLNAFLKKAQEILKNELPANAILLRGLATPPAIPLFPERFKVKAGAIATYPMYKGLARLVGMEILKVGGESYEDEFKTYIENYDKYDYFFIHIKGTDSAGEDGDFARKVKMIEEVDRILPILTAKMPAVLAVTGDHSTPALLKSHSWHPVPLLVCSKYVSRDSTQRLTEQEAVNGALGMFPSRDLMKILLSNAKRMDKYGA